MVPSAGVLPTRPVHDSSRCAESCSTGVFPSSFYPRAPHQSASACFGSCDALSGLRLKSVACTAVFKNRTAPCGLPGAKWPIASALQDQCWLCSKPVTNVWTNFAAMTLVYFIQYCKEGVDPAS